MIRQRGTPMRALAKELKSAGDGLDLALKKELKAIAADIVPEARAKAAAAHPTARTPEHDGAWKWGTLVKGITAGSDQSGPFLKFNVDKLPGAMGWVFGSDRMAQFPARKPTGYFFFPQVDAAKPEAEKRVAAVVEQYIEQLGGS